MTRRDSSSRGSIAHDSRAAMWPGITRGFDARCSCTWGMHQGVYQVKVRDAAMCPNHAGDLASVLRRMESGQWISGAALQGDAG